jgi:hypothetical protein
MWYEVFSFEADPYQKLDPFNIEISRLSWNRPDLSLEREKINHFVQDVIAGNRVGLIGYGAIGSGKTWVARILQKEIQEKQPNSIFIYTKVHKIEPTFSVIYENAMESVLAQLNGIKKAVLSKTGKENIQGWQEAFPNADLAKGLANIFMGGTKGLTAKRWLLGNKCSSTDLDSLEIINPVDSDYKQYKILKDLISSLTTLFPAVVLVVDELDNAPVKLASVLSDSFRNMLDEFASHFALVCLFTAQAVEEWYEYGYTEPLLRRIDYKVTLSSLKPKALPAFLRAHHALYRKKGETVEDQLCPFTEEGAIALLKQMPIEKHFPSYFFDNCEAITKRAAEDKINSIDPAYILKNKQRLSYQYKAEMFRLDDYKT